MLEPGTTVEFDGNAGSGRRLPAGIQPSETAQSAGLREPGGFCGAELSIPSSGRASPSLCRGWTKNKQKHKLNHVPGLTHGLDQKSEAGHIYKHASQWVNSNDRRPADRARAARRAFIPALRPRDFGPYFPNKLHKQELVTYNKAA